MDWGSTANPKRYNGIEYARTIYFTHGIEFCRLPTNLSQINAVTGTALINRVKGNPGALWMVGNEPDGFLMAAHYRQNSMPDYIIITIPQSRKQTL